jgi:hypothetical protein
MSRSPLSPSDFTALHDAWWRNGGDISAFPAALAALPPRIGSAGWPHRWAVAARAALDAAARAARAARAERAAAAWWAERAAEDAAPIWGVIREYGVGHWSHSYNYTIARGAGKMSRSEADAAAKAAYASDKVAQSHKKAWDDFMLS